MSQVIFSDNVGRSVPPVQAVDVVAGSGVKCTHGTADTNVELTVEAEAQYVFTALKTGGFIFGLAATTTAANVRWVCPLGESIIISIPVGNTSLHYAPDTNNAVGYLRKLAE